MLPGNGDFDVDAKHACQDGGGEFGGELEQCGGPGFARSQAEVAEPFAEPVGADGPAGLTSGEQPARCAPVAEHGVAFPVCGQFAGERGERLGKLDGYRSEAEPDGAVTGADVEVVEGEAADRRGLLGVEQDQQPGDTVAGGEGIVVQQPAGLLPAFVVVQRPGGAGPPGGGELQAGVDAERNRPADEVAGFGFAGSVVAGQPSVEVGLGTAGDGQAAVAQPAQQADGGTTRCRVTSSCP